MAVYARGYREYGGGFEGSPPAVTIFKDAFRSVARRKAFRWFAILVLLWFAICTIGLYVAVQVQEFARSSLGGMSFGDASWIVLREALMQYYGGIVVLMAVFAMFIGAPLVADDLRTRALPLYLVRPIRPGDYVAGKALVIPAALLLASFFPGVFFLLLMASWQPPGESMTFLGEHVDVIGVAALHTAVAGASYTGLLLFLSSRSSRRAAVVGLAAVAIFGGFMLQGLGVGIRDAFPNLSDVLRCLGLPFDGMSVVARGLYSAESLRGRKFHWLPPRGGAEIVSGALLALGLWSTWRRARTVEVTG